ncbi:MAG: DUF29 family protein [Methylomonas sp.]|jgi:hypothetical protein
MWSAFGKRQQADLVETDWWDLAWPDAIRIAVNETGLDCFPESCPWDFDHIINLEFWPE